MLVVGGGVVGAGVALDAVTRGLSTALIEQRDLASGTSSLIRKEFEVAVLDIKRSGLRPDGKGEIDEDLL